MDASAARALLGIAPSADLDQVEHAFRVIARQAHPDHGGDAERFRQLVAARDVLRGQLGSPAVRVGGPRAPVIVVPQRSFARRMVDSFDRRARPPRVI